MFAFFKSNPIKKLRKNYHLKLTSAMLAQRNGDIRGYAMLTAQAEDLCQKIVTLEEQQE